MQNEGHYRPSREVTMRFLAEPGDVNFGGKVHGGIIMKWIDQAGYACAVQWSGRYCLTVYVGGVRFFQPVRVSNMVEIRAKVIYTGQKSIHIAVDVKAGDPKVGRFVPTTHCMIVFVPVDDDGRVLPARVWRPKSPEDIALQSYARKFAEFSKNVETDLTQHIFVESAVSA